MIKKISYIILCGVLMAACTGTQQFKTIDSNINQFTDREKRVVFLGEMPLEVEIVSIAESTAQGLSGRNQIGADGMLFIFPTTRERSFWMKEMQFAIDMVWINEGKVVGITSDVPTPSAETPLNDLPLYSSTQPVDMVLELPAGDAARREIKVGSSLLFK
jgi:hypothetical protein